MSDDNTAPGWARHGGARRPGSWQQQAPSGDNAVQWLLHRLPGSWFVSEPTVTVDRDEVIVIGQLAEPAGDDDLTDGEREALQRSRIARFREQTREQRMALAGQLERGFRRKVGWGAVCGEVRELFTTLSSPVMTRLRQPERQVLDTLVDSGVARSRSDALAWCVRLVSEHADSWLSELRHAMLAVDELRRQGPTTKE